MFSFTANQRNSPQEFFDRRVLIQKEAREWLALLLSAAESNWEFIPNVIKRKPKIWLLTGIYRLIDGAVEDEDNSQFYLSAEVGPAILGPATGLPLTVSSEGSVFHQQAKELGMAGQRVWAARFQMLDLSHIGRYSWGETFPRSVPLSRSRYSYGIEGGPDEQTQPVEIVCVHEPGIEYWTTDKGFYIVSKRPSSTQEGDVEEDEFVENLESLTNECSWEEDYADEGDDEYYTWLATSKEALTKVWAKDSDILKRLQNESTKYKKLMDEQYERTLCTYKR